VSLKDEDFFTFSSEGFFFSAFFHRVERIISRELGDNFNSKKISRQKLDRYPLPSAVRGKVIPLPRPPCPYFPRRRKVRTLFLLNQEPFDNGDIVFDTFFCNVLFYSSSFVPPV